MAHLELSRREADLLLAALQAVQPEPKPELKAIQKKIGSLSFNLRRCLACGTVFEAANPRKQTCSDGCRQALSRSKRYGCNSFLHQRVITVARQRHSSTVPPGGHNATVTKPAQPEPLFKVGDMVAKGKGLKAFPIRRRKFSGGHWMYEIDSPIPCGFEKESNFTAGA